MSLSLTAHAKSGKKKAEETKKLNAYVEVLNLTGKSVQSTSKNYSRWKDSGHLGEGCATKHIQWPNGLVRPFTRLQPTIETAISLKGKTKVDAVMKRWSSAAAPLAAADKEIASHFCGGLHKKDNCVEAKKLVAKFEQSLSEFAQARWERQCLL